MQPISTGLDILQGEKNIYVGYFLPTVLMILHHLKEALTHARYIKFVITLFWNLFANSSPMHTQIYT